MSEDPGDEARKICSVLSKKDSIFIFNLAAEGIDASLDVLKKYNFSKKRYYTRLKELLDLKVIFKENGMYKHTALGSLIFEHQVKGLRQILLNRGSIEILQSLRDHVSDDARSTIEAISHEVLKELESRLGLSSLKPIRLFTSWDELVAEVALYIEKMQSEMYLASRYMDFRALEKALINASRGCKIHIIHSNRTGMSTRLQILGNLMVHPKSLGVFRDLARNANVYLRQADIPYSFIVIDKLHVGIEIVNPSDLYSFFMGLQLQSPTLAQKLVSHFNEIFKNADKHPIVEIFERSTEDLGRLLSEDLT